MNEKFTTPLEFVLKSIEGTTARQFITELNKQMGDTTDGFSTLSSALPIKPITVGRFEKHMTEAEIGIVKWVYKKVGWKLTMSASTDEDGLVTYVVYLFID